MGIASLVIGIISLILSIFVGGITGIIPAIVGIILGILGRKDETQKSMATGGLVCSIIALVLGLIIWIACALVLGGWRLSPFFYKKTNLWKDKDDTRTC